MTFKISQRDQALMQLKNIINQTLSDVPANVYLFGSWARKEEKRTSDIDIALQSKVEIPWVELRERIEESTLPYNVDVVDLSKIDSVFSEKILREGILWRDYRNDFNSQIRH